MPRRRMLIVLALIAIAAIVAVGVSQAPHSSKVGSVPSAAAAARELAGSPPALADLHAQASELLGGGSAAVRARLRALQGHPVVINKWASWCGPCRTEFPLFARESVTYGHQVAFLGLDSADNHGDARTFLARFPVSYPSYTDPSGRLGTALTKSTNFPVTVFYDRRGNQTFIHQGEYLNEAQLSEDVQHYAVSA